ncbi:MAG: aldo/keto reductase [Acidimicrobiia bacterium]|nr:aldo/keto reductase [Acidimicrobiia bacterium]
MQRRTFFGGVFAGIGLSSTKAKAAKTGGDIPKRTFGKTGVKLTLVGQAGGRFPLCTFEEAKAITRRAYDLGVNYFDNAHSYWNGRSEEVFGAALEGIRKEIFITTKTTKRSRAEAEAELHLSLKRMKTDYVDLWQIHSIKEKAEVDEIFAPGGAIEAFEAAKKAGKCRFIGFTGHFDPHAHLEMLKRYDRYDTILMPLHIADPAYLSFEKLVLPEAVKRKLGIQAMKTTANAKLLQSFSVGQCLGYALSLPVHCAAIGCTTIGQLEDDVRIAQQFRAYNDAEMNQLRSRAGRLKGPGLEDWKRNVESAAIDRPAYTGG